MDQPSRLSQCAAENVRRMRSERGMTQAMAAKALRVTRGRLSQLESGRDEWSLWHVEAYAAALGCTPADIIAEQPAPAAQPRLRGRPPVLRVVE